MGLCHFDPTITFPITIGTYPIAEREWVNTSNIFLRPVDDSSQEANQPTTSTTEPQQPQKLKPSAPFPESGNLNSLKINYKNNLKSD